MRHGSGLLMLLVAALASMPAAAQPRSCADEVKALQASPELRIQGGTAGQRNGRANANLYLEMAARAAAQNDEKACRENLQRAQVSMTY